MGKRETDYPHTISFRVTDEAWLGIQSAIDGSDLTPHELCRRAALERFNINSGLSRSERLLFENFVRAQYLFINGFQLLADDRLTGERWKEIRANAKRRAAEISNQMLASCGDLNT